MIPVKADGSKEPSVLDSRGKSTGRWKPYQTTKMSVAEASKQFSRDVGIAIVCGAISGGLDILDVESHVNADEFFKAVEAAAPGLLDMLPRVATPSGGYHLYLRRTVSASNTVLARAMIDEKIRILIETRAEGGLATTISSPGACHPTGRQYELLHGRITETPVISEDQVHVLHECARAFNTYVKPQQVYKARQPAAHNGLLRPGDDYNRRGQPLELLKTAGWTVDRAHGDSLYLRKPGKKQGVSATFGHVGPNVLYVFSTSAEPFEFERAYDPFGIYCVLLHNGDSSSAARALAADGYGESRHSEVVAEARAAQVIQFPQQPGQTPESPARSPQGNTVEAMAQLTLPTEDAVALLFERFHADRLRYCKSWGTWLSWVGHYWEPEKTGLALDHARQIARLVNVQEEKSAAKASFARGVETLASVSRSFATETSQWDQEHMRLATPAGTVDLRETAICPPNQLHYITKSCRVSPADGPRPVFERFMRDICLEDQALIDYHQRALGSCLSGALTDHWILFWIGSGRNGKNTLGDLIAWILGDYAKTISSDTLMSSMSGTKHPTDLASLRGVRLAIASEVAEGAYWDDARIKSLTGDETISARFMRQDYFEFRRTHKHLIFGNNRPMLRVVDEALKARLHVVPFKANFSGDAGDPEMPKKLREEAPQILQWLIDGHELWVEDGTLRRCTAVQEETDRYFESQSTPEMWASECCLFGPEYVHAETSASDLYSSFKSWKDARGEKPMSQTRWGEWMSGRYQKRKAHGTMVYDSIKINPEAETPTSNRRMWDER